MKECRQGVQKESSVMLFTERLRLRPPEATDLEFFVRLYGNGANMRHVPPWRAASRQETQERLQRLIRHWEERRYGMFLIEWRKSSSPLGYCGLRFMPEVAGIELGYIIDEPNWGLGLATEAAAACVRFADGKLGAGSLVSVTDPVNEGSQKVLLKLGFQRAPRLDGVYHGSEHRFFRRESAEPQTVCGRNLSGS